MVYLKINFVNPISASKVALYQATFETPQEGFYTEVFFLLVVSVKHIRIESTNKQ